MSCTAIDLDLPLCTFGHQERGSGRGWVEGTLRTPRTRVEPTTETHTHVHMYTRTHAHTCTVHTHTCTHITTYDIVTYKLTIFTPFNFEEARKVSKDIQRQYMDMCE